jgi:cytochrome P450
MWGEESYTVECHRIRYSPNIDYTPQRRIDVLAKPLSGARVQFSKGLNLNLNSTAIMQYFIVSQGLLISYILYLIGSRILRSRQNAAKAKALQCEEPPYEKSRLPLGVSQLRRAVKAMADQSWPDYTIQRAKDVGALTFATNILGAGGFFTADEHNIQAILATQFDDFELGQARRNNTFPFLGDGIFNSDGKLWAHHRALLRPQFSREQVSHLEADERHVQALLRSLRLSPEKDNWTEALDLQPLFFHFSLDAFTEFMFGKSVESQRISVTEVEDKSGSKKGEDDEFGVMFDRCTAGVLARALFGPFGWLVWPRGFKNAIEVVHSSVDAIVSDHLHELQEVKTGKGDDATSDEKKDRYVLLNVLTEQTQDPIELRSALINTLIAGRDTTACLLGWVFFALARDGPRFKKLRNAIVQDFGTYAKCDIMRDITFSKMKDCKYLQYILNEALRVYPLAPLGIRAASRDTTLPRGGGKDGKSKIFVPKGSHIEFNNHVLHHREDLWGSDADKFIPERWEGRKMGWDYLPVR